MCWFWWSAAAWVIHGRGGAGGGPSASGQLLLLGLVLGSECLQVAVRQVRQASGGGGCFLRGEGLVGGVPNVVASVGVFAGRQYCVPVVGAYEVYPVA